METSVKTQPQYPIFIPTKGRYESNRTSRALTSINVAHTLVVEPQEARQYANLVGVENLLVTPHRDKGLSFTRNFIWDYARDHGFKRFWTMDDNINNFYRYNRNLKVQVSDGSMLRAIETFTERYLNVPIAGMNYFMFAPRKSGGIQPFTLNTRVYSNMLIDTFATNPRGVPYRNVTYYNDDTDLCIRVLKDGNCTILFNAFLIDKATTMTVKGGNTDDYQGDGRYKMALELQKAHPDITTITRKWGRWQHLVDYRQFKRNKLIRRSGAKVEPGVDNFGMSLVKTSLPRSDKRKSKISRLTR